MSKKKMTIAAMFKKEDSLRWESLNIARRCAALTKPSACPTARARKDAALPMNFQAIGGRGVNNLEGLVYLAMFGGDGPFFELSPAVDVRYDESIPPDDMNFILDDLFRRELMAVSLLESVSFSDRTNRRQQAFQTNKRAVVSQFITTGDALERMNHDYSISVFQRAKYVTDRDTTGNVNWHITEEDIDPLAMSEEDYHAAGFKENQFADTLPAERMKLMHTFPEWNPQSKLWVIKQEVNGIVINTSEDEVTPFFSTPFMLEAGDNYGHGLVEQNLGDLSSLDALMEKLLDFAAAFSKVNPVIDSNEMTLTAKHLEKKSGTPLRAKVRGGRVESVAWLKPDNSPQFRMVSEHAKFLTSELGKAFLIESAVTPQKERVTAEQVRRIASELEGTLSGYGPVATSQHVQTVRRTLWQMSRDLLVGPLDEDLYEIRVKSGTATLQRDRQRAKLFNLPQFIQMLPEKAQRKIDFGVLLDASVRLSGLDIPGLIRNDEDVAAEIRVEQQQAAQVQAQQKAVDVGGNVAEQRLLGTEAA